MKKAQQQYPDKKCVFILVVEDNSQGILINPLKSDQSLSILDIAECVNEILQYPEIDGVILQNTSTRGDFLLAEDSVYLRQQRDTEKLIWVEFSALLSSLQRILISKASNYAEKGIKQLEELKAILTQFLQDDFNDFEVSEFINITYNVQSNEIEVEYKVKGDNKTYNDFIQIEELKE